MYYIVFNFYISKIYDNKSMEISQILWELDLIAANH